MYTTHLLLSPKWLYFSSTIMVIHCSISLNKIIFVRPLYTECRLSITNSSIARLSSENVINGVIMGGDTPSTSDLDSNNKVQALLSWYL